MNTPGSYHCQCKVGFLLDDSGRNCSGIYLPALYMCMYNFTFYIDIDECSEGSHDCEQMCINTHGSYTCSCDEGYEALNNGRSCVGMQNKCSTM